jgi:hypothetical protein
VLDGAFSVNIYSAYNIFYVKAFSVIVVKLRKITRYEMAFVELFAIIVIYNVAILINFVTAAGDDGTIAIDMVSKFVFLDFGVAIPIILKVASHLMWIKVILLNIERCWQLTSLIDIFTREHLLLIKVIDHISFIIS